MSTKPIDIPSSSSKERSLSEQFDASSAETKKRILSMTGSKPTSKIETNYSIIQAEKEKHNLYIKNTQTPTTKSMLNFWGMYQSPP